MTAIFVTIVYLILVLFCMKPRERRINGLWLEVGDLVETIFEDRSRTPPAAGRSSHCRGTGRGRSSRRISSRDRRRSQASRAPRSRDERRRSSRRTSPRDRRRSSRQTWSTDGPRPCFPSSPSRTTPRRGRRTWSARRRAGRCTTAPPRPSCVVVSSASTPACDGAVVGRRARRTVAVIVRNHRVRDHTGDLAQRR